MGAWEGAAGAGAAAGVARAAGGAGGAAQGARAVWGAVGSGLRAQSGCMALGAGGGGGGVGQGAGAAAGAWGGEVAWVEAGRSGCCAGVDEPLWHHCHAPGCPRHGTAPMSQPPALPRAAISLLLP